MSETVLQITDEALIKWVKQYAAAREESLGAIVTEALGEYRERILGMVKSQIFMGSGALPNTPHPPPLYDEMIVADNGGMTVEQAPVAPKPAIPPMVPSPEELF